MPASKAEQILDALKTLLETVPGAKIERNGVLPEKIPTGGLIILRDGDPGEPEQALGGFGSTYYQHAVEIEVYVEEGDARTRPCGPWCTLCMARAYDSRRRLRWSVGRSTSPARR